jgi:hypothetical protein
MFMPMRSSSFFCSSSGSDRLSTTNESSARPRSANVGASAALSVRRQLHLVPRHVEERDLRLGERVGDAADDRVAQVTFEIGDRVALARAADLLMEDLGIGDVEAVEAEAAQPHHAEILVADRDRLLRAPALIGLGARGEEVHVALEGRLEARVPVLEVGEQRQRLRLERVQPGAELIRDLPLVDEERQLRLADGEARAVLDLHVAHRIPEGEHAVAVLRPLDDVDELLAQKVAERHGSPPQMYLEGAARAAPRGTDLTALTLRWQRARSCGRSAQFGDIGTDLRAGPRDGAPFNDNGANPDDPDLPDTAGSIPLRVEMLGPAQSPLHPRRQVFDGPGRDLSAPRSNPAVSGHPSNPGPCRWTAPRTDRATSDDPALSVRSPSKIRVPSFSGFKSARGQTP